MTRYKCNRCKLELKKESLIDGIGCPQCEQSDMIVEMCQNDHSNCSHDIAQGIAYCDICGEACCPECGSHDVTQISRVTGYLQEVDGWNAGKRQELKDRKRYEVGA